MATRSVPLLLAGEVISGFSLKVVYLNFLVLLTRFLGKKAYEATTLGWLITRYPFLHAVWASATSLSPAS